MIEPAASAKPTLTELLKEVGSNLGFHIKAQVEASESAFVDVVWFDNRFPIPGKQRTGPTQKCPFCLLTVGVRTDSAMVFVPPWIDGLVVLGVPNVASVLRWLLSIWFLGIHSRSTLTGITLKI
jgi:hypothetical protein